MSSPDEEKCVFVYSRLEYQFILQSKPGMMKKRK